jgi:prepilin peptidase CpaA
MLIVYAILTCFMFAVILNDVSRYLIPNWLVLALIVFYPVAVYVAPVRPDWGMACVVSIAMFAVGFFILARFIGGGDVKLLTAAVLYTGQPSTLDFIIYLTLLGGAGTVLLLLLRHVIAFLFTRLGKPLTSVPRVLKVGEKYVPYGVAIAGSFLILLWGGKLPGLVL